MKPIRMVWVGASHPNHVESGKTYVVVGKEREINPDGSVWYTYLFIDDIGNTERAASRLFLKPKGFRTK